MPNLITRLVLEHGQFDRGIKGSVAEMKKMERQCQTVNKGFSNFSQGLGVNVGTLSKFATGLGLAAVAGEGLNKFFSASQTYSDQFTNALNASAGTLNAFMFALNTANFDSFVDGWGAMWDKMKAISEGKDTLGDMNLSDSLFDKETLNRINAIKAMMKDKTVSKADKEAAAAEAEQLVSEQMARVNATNAQNKKLLMDTVSAYSINYSDVEAGYAEVKEYLMYANHAGTEQGKQLLQYVNALDKASELQKRANSALIAPGDAQYNMSQYKEYSAQAKAERDIAAQLEAKNGHLKNWAILYKHNDDLRAEEAGYLSSMLDNEKKIADLEVTRATIRNKLLAESKEEKSTEKKTTAQKPTVNKDLNTIEGLRNVISELEKNMAQTADQSLRNSIKSKIEMYQEAIKSMQNGSYGAKLSTLGVAPDNSAIVPTETTLIPPELPNTAKELADQLQRMQNAQDIIGSIGEAMNALVGDTKAAKVATAGLVVVTQALAIASAVKAATPGDPYTLPARVAAAAAACVAAFANCFADGGIVGGTRDSRSTDKVNARLSAGEMVLSHADQSNLYHMIKEGNVQGNGNVQFIIRGQDLVGVFGNYESKISRVR